MQMSKRRGKLNQENIFNSIKPFIICKQEIKDMIKNEYDYIVAEVDQKMIGYVVFKKISEMDVCQLLFDLDCPSKEAEYIDFIKKNMSNGIYISAIEVLKEYRNMGIGKELFNSLENVPTLLYSCSETMDFWYNQGFDMLESDGYWMYKID